MLHSSSSEVLSLSSHIWINFSRGFVYFLNHQPFFNILTCPYPHPPKKIVQHKIISIVHVTRYKWSFVFQRVVSFILKTTLQALPSFCDGRLSCFSFYFDNHLFSAFFLAIKSYSCHVSVVNHVLALLYPFPR